jgi:energy-coupling factor transporter transmembrane protein EcfT
MEQPDRVKELEAELQKLQEDRREVLTMGEMVKGISTLAILFVWLILATRIIWSATSNPEVAENIEGLLLPLAIIGGPATGILTAMWAVANGKKGEKE